MVSVSQTKEKIRNGNEVLIDLHFHLGKNKNLRSVLNRIFSVADIIALTSRGHRFQNLFEHNFETFCDALREEKISHKQINKVIIEISLDHGTLIIIKAQEIYTAEGFDIVIVGSENDYKDDTPYEKLLADSKNSLQILSTPYNKPNTLAFRKSTDQIVEKIAKNADCIETYNQNLFITKANRLAKQLSQRINKPGIAVSDSHLYSKRNYPIHLSGIIVDRKKIKDPNDVIPLLKQLIQEKAFRSYPTFTMWSIFEFCSLRFKDIKSLYYGNER